MNVFKFDSLIITRFDDEGLPSPINDDDIASLQANLERLLEHTHDMYMPWASKPFCDKLFDDEICDRIINQESDEFEPDVIPTYEDMVEQLDIFGGKELFRVGTDWYSRSNAAGEENSPLTEQHIKVVYSQYFCEHDQNGKGLFTNFLFNDKRIANIVFSRIIWAPPYAPPMYVYGNVHPDDLPGIQRKTRNLFPGLAHEAWTKPPEGPT